MTSDYVADLLTRSRDIISESVQLALLMQGEALQNMRLCKLTLWQLAATFSELERYEILMNLQGIIIDQELRT